MPPSPIILIISYWLMRTPGCGADAAAWIPVAPPEPGVEPGVLGGVPGVLPGALPGTIPLGVSHAERGAIPDGPSDGRRARPELATVPCGTCCGTGVPFGIVGSATRATGHRRELGTRTP